MFEKFQVKQPVKPHVSARVRAYGRARIDIARRALTPQDWDELWKPPQNPFPFTWGTYWKQCIEYRVDDFASEAGFFIDVLGFPVIAFDANYAMFTSPTGEFTFAVVQTPEDGTSTPPDAIRIQFMVEDIYKTTEELARRGIAFTQTPEPLSGGSSMHTATFLSPHGICIDVWGEVRIATAEVVEMNESEEVELLSEVEPLSEEETVDEHPKQPTSIKSRDPDDDFEDLFEEIHDEPAEKPRLAKQNKPQIKTSEAEDDLHDEVQYVDEPDVNYPAYTPIPVRR
jgi:catechol 2,3-dioxygenase-like lactoylglutathione lyase family enzyme